MPNRDITVNNWGKDDLGGVTKLPTNKEIIFIDNRVDEILGEQLFIFTETEMFRLDDLGSKPIRVW